MRVVSWRDRLRPELWAVQAYSVPAQEVPVKLDANENPYHLSDDARADLARELARIDLNRYPDPRATRLKEALAESLGVMPEQVLLGCGVDEIIGLLATAFARPPEGRSQAAVMYPWPSFAMFRITSQAHGLRLVEVPLDEAWQLRADRALGAIEAEDPGVIFFPSPNNPTGNRLDPEVMRAVIESTPGALTVVDEAYFDFCGSTLLPLVHAHPGLAVFRTLSKMGLAGLRVGALVGHPDLVRELDKARQPYNLNALSQRAAELALTRFKDELAGQARRIVVDREKLSSALRELPGMTVFPSDANFILIRLAANASEVWEKLLAQGVLVRNLDAPGPLAGCLRVTVGTPAENERFLETLAGILNR
ncbi:MAG: histidinol-phosphate transaminase [Deltaproteobacteria bacterium]|nr:histidinol-phosphate transaminase [Deltaproteobacteria bacterium]